jgi:hypothetical protein
LSALLMAAHRIVLALAAIAAVVLAFLLPRLLAPSDAPDVRPVQLDRPAPTATPAPRATAGPGPPSRALPRR